MKKYRTILVDDEVLAIDRLTRLLRPYSDAIDIIDVAYSGEDAVNAIQQLEPDLVFLDIQMPEIGGFEVIERLNHMPIIIFVTAYDQYALRAFETNSIDYLLKPIDPARLEHAIEKLLRLQNGDQQQTNSSLREQFDSLLKAVKASHPKRIQVSVGDSIRLLPISEICFFRAADKYVEVYCFEEMYLISNTLSTLLRELPEDDFVRIHRSTIINLNYLDEIIRGITGNFSVRMKNKRRSILPVSRSMRRNLGIVSGA